MFDGQAEMTIRNHGDVGQVRLRTKILFRVLLVDVYMMVLMVGLMRRDDSEKVGMIAWTDL